MRQDEAKDLKFEVFEGLDGLWMVCGWGEIVNNRTGFYDFKIHLCKLYDSVFPESQGTHDYAIHPSSPIIVREVNIGLLKFVPFGTIIKNGQVKAHLWDYRTQPKEIQINPTSFQDVKIGQWLETHADFTKRSSLVNLMVSGLENAPAKLFDVGDTKVLFMENDLIDYFFMAGSPRMAHYIFDAKIDRDSKKKNKVYDPSLVSHGVDPKGNKIVHVRLERGMYDSDALLIAILAHDEYYWNEASKIQNSIVKGEKYLRANIPIEKTTTFKVFGRRIDLKEGSGYLVHRIITCDWKLPFESLLFSRDNPGAAAATDPSQQPENNGKAGFLFFPPRKPKRGSPPTPVTNKKAGWRTAEQPIAFSNTQSFNFPESNIIKEERFVDGNLGDKKNSPAVTILKNAGFTTSLADGSDDSIVRIVLLSDSPAKPAPGPALTCFELVEKAVGHVHQICTESLQVNPTWSYRIPFKYNDSNYSIFEGRNYLEEEDPDVKNFCFVQIKKRGHKIFRRICIIEVDIRGEFFYLMDVEPKYNGRSGFTFSKIAWIYAGVRRFGDNDLGNILHRFVLQKGSWDFLSDAGYVSEKIMHYPEPERIATGLINFVFKKFDLPPYKKVKPPQPDENGKQ